MQKLQEQETILTNTHFRQSFGAIVVVSVLFPSMAAYGKRILDDFLVLLHFDLLTKYSKFCL